VGYTLRTKKGNQRRLALKLELSVHLVIAFRAYFTLDVAKGGLLLGRDQLQRAPVRGSAHAYVHVARLRHTPPMSS
jgi:hypothetical protein